MDEIGRTTEIKAEIVKRWSTDNNNNTASAPEAVEDEEDEVAAMSPVEKLLRKRKAASSSTAPEKSLTTLETEFLIFENKMEVSKDADRASWWKSHKEEMPNLHKVVVEVFSVPCSSSKSERVFSTTGLNMTKKRMRLNPRKLEDLTIISENNEVLRTFSERPGFILNKEDPRSMKKIRLVKSTEQNVEEMGSDVFEDKAQEEDNSEEEFVDIDELLGSDDED